MNENIKIFNFNKLFLLIFVIFTGLILVACQCNYDSNPKVEIPSKTGEISSVNLISPATDEVIESRSPLFTWQSIENASTYTLVVALDSDFEVLVLKKTNLSTSTFQLRSALKLNTTYYWKVIAYNDDFSKESEVKTFSCTLVGEDAETIIDLEGDYYINEGGITFNHEYNDNHLKINWDNNSIGWGILRHFTNSNMSGGNAIYIDFDYSGSDTSISIRLLEEDSDLWVAEIPTKVANNISQVSIIPYTSFNLKKDESFGDGELHFDYVQRIDIVINAFESGSMNIAQIKSVNENDYKEMPISAIDLQTEASYSVNAGGYPLDVTISKENILGNGKDALILSWDDLIADTGWGVTTLYVDRDLVSANALTFDFKSEGFSGTYLIRLVEADQDKWVARFNGISGLTQQVLIQFDELLLREDESEGDGVVQLDKLVKIEFCVESIYSSGKAIFSNLQFIHYEEPAQSSFGFNGVFSDNMILQRDRQIRINGYGEEGEQLTVHFNGNDYPVVVSNNKWEVLLPSTTAGGEYTISVTDGSLTESIENVTFGDVYLFVGQSNMFFKLAQTTDKPNNNNDIRIYFQHQNPKDEPQSFSQNGYWQAATTENALGASAIGWYTGNLLNQELGVPIGVINAAVGGTFIESWLAEDYYSGNRTDKNLYYNGMIAPIMNMDISGVVWYQGENNVGWPAEYEVLLKSFIECYIDGFENDDLQFYIISLPYFDHPYNWGFMREIQTKVTNDIDNAHLITTLDGGNVNDIHPTEKLYIAERVTNLILQYNNNYQIVSDMPYYSGHVVDGSSMYLSFAFSDGLNLKGTAQSFEIAGANGIFYPANAEVVNGKVRIWSDAVASPLYARYAFHSVTTATLFNGDGLPVNSFRTYTDMKDIALTLTDELVDTSFYDGNNKSYTYSIVNGEITINYNNQINAGWGIVRIKAFTPINGGDYLVMNYANSGDTSIAIRMNEVDGDMWQGKLVVENNIAYIALDKLTWVQGWGDKILDVNNLIEYIEIVFEGNYNAGTLILSSIRIDDLVVDDTPKDIISIDDFSQPESVNLWTMNHEYGADTLLGKTLQIEGDRTYINFNYGKKFGNSNYILDLSSRTLLGSSISFDLKGDNQCVFFVKITDTNGIVYSIQINQPINEWKTYTYSLASLFNDQGVNQTLKAENIVSIKFQIQDWANGVQGTITSISVDSLILHN